MAKITIAGSGGFGTALAIMAAQNGHRVTLWSAFQPEIDALLATREHKKLLPGVKIPDSVELTTALDSAASADLVVVAVPSSAVRPVARTLAGAIGSGIPVASVAKGFEGGSLKRLSEVYEEELPHNPIVVMSGPSHAEEVAVGIPTTIVAASKSKAAAEFVQDTLMNDRLRIYLNGDLIGVELGGALKNVIALAAGICDGLGLGDNTKAALMTRGLTEMARLGTAMGAQRETFAGLSGVGDLIVTCTSMHSRNRRAGILIGQGRTAEQAIEEVGMTVEGYNATQIAWQLSRRYGVNMPIVEQMYGVLFEGHAAREGVSSLMTRPRGHEIESVWVSD